MNTKKIKHIYTCLNSQFYKLQALKRLKVIVLNEKISTIILALRLETASLVLSKEKNISTSKIPK